MSLPELLHSDKLGSGALQAMWGRRRSEQLPSYAYAYFDHVEAEYRSLPSDHPDVATKAVADDVIAKCHKGRGITWADLYALENAVLQLQPDNRLPSKAAILRQKYREMAGPAAYDTYIQSKPPDPNGDPALLRADLHQLLGEFHWLYALTPIRERIRTSILRRVAIFIAAFCVGVGILVWHDYHSVGGSDLPQSGPQIISSAALTPPTASVRSRDDHRTFRVPTLPIVLAAGMLGAFVSLQRRVQSMSNAGDPVMSIFELNHGRVSIYLSPIVGAVFALILYLLFIGKFLEGAIFPTMTSAGGPFSLGMTLHDFTQATGPTAGTEYAKLLVWSFVAGFAEALVPDTLDRLTAKAKTDKGAVTP
jgi:hypothetical protein